MGLSQLSLLIAERPSPPLHIPTCIPEGTGFLYKPHSEANHINSNVAVRIVTKWPGQEEAAGDSKVWLNEESERFRA